MCNSQTHTPWGGLTLRSQSVFIKTSPKPNPHLGKDLGAPTSTSHRQRQGRGPRSLDTEREQSGGRLRQGRRVPLSLRVTWLIPRSGRSRPLPPSRRSGPWCLLRPDLAPHPRLRSRSGCAQQLRVPGTISHLVAGAGLRWQ